MTNTDKSVIECVFEINKNRMRIEDFHRYFKEKISRDEFDVEQRNINDLIYELQRTITSLQVFSNDLKKV